MIPVAAAVLLLVLALPALVERTRRTGRTPYAAIEPSPRVARLQQLDLEQGRRSRAARIHRALFT